MQQFLEKLYSSREYGKIIFSYEGDFQENSVDEILNGIEANIKLENITTQLTRKIFRVAVEAVQNLYHHIETKKSGNIGSDKRFAHIVLSKKAELIQLSSGNLIAVDNIDALKKRLDLINNMDQKELKTQYRKTLENQEYTSKGGGSLGLIEIARKAGNKLHYSFHSFDTHTSFLTIDIQFNIKESNKE